MKRIAILNVVGLTAPLLRFAPNLRKLSKSGHITLSPDFPAVTCTSQSSILTGTPPKMHGATSNGWFFEDTQEIRFWQQSNQLVSGEKIWQTLKKQNPNATCLNSFWWYNMYSDVDYSITPRPQYRANGRKIPDCYTHPASLRDKLQQQLGNFPLFRFWGPMADITSSQWIADATQITWQQYQPDLTLVYLPHLDYPLQKLGPNHPDIAKEVAAIDKICGKLIDFFAQQDVQTIALSEYGISPVTHAVFPNRLLREAGLLAIRTENGRELMDAGASRAFAVCDHQAAWIYVKDPADVALAKQSLQADGIARVIDAKHPRQGAFGISSARGTWFAHDWWDITRPEQAPDFQTCVDIHRKPGYDPRELFCSANKFGVAWRLLRMKIGFRQLMDVIPVDDTLVKGSHGHTAQDGLTDAELPVLLGLASDQTHMDMKDIKNAVIAHMMP